MSYIDAMACGMRCPVCGGQSTVKDSRLSKAVDNAIRRRRECLGCGYRFSTLETVVDGDRRAKDAAD